MLALWLVLPLALSTAVHAETGIASHYSSKDRDQNGSKTACGPRLRDSGLTMAHRRLPCGTRVRVTNHRNAAFVTTLMFESFSPAPSAGLSSLL
jgi:rare lipoprotein A (peptidoglycan hydrolase)